MPTTADQAHVLRQWAGVYMAVAYYEPVDDAARAGFMSAAAELIRQAQLLEGGECGS